MSRPKPLTGERMKDENGVPVRYCRYCGKKMTLTKKEDRGWYSGVTGEWLPEWHYWYACPDRKWFLSPHNKCLDVDVYI